jgi:hypothetical protein
MQVTEKVQKQLGIDDAWLLVHRVDLHNALREKAEEGTEGRKLLPGGLSCELSLSSWPSSQVPLTLDKGPFYRDCIPGKRAEARS